jgi:ribosomal protein S16
MGLLKFLVLMIHIQRYLVMDFAEANEYIANGAQYSDTLAKIVAKKA